MERKQTVRQNNTKYIFIILNYFSNKLPRYNTNMLEYRWLVLLFTVQF